mmetsp:Transcript_5412/g.9871  ORF Transcript_5412/g.9871 Transcript_5412/m.9871 type:complete len:175 (-) Transcript_5412:200-724(-)
MALFTPAQQSKILSEIPHITSLFSLFGSSYIIITILKDRKKKWTKPYYRLLFAMCVFDVFSSAALGLSTWSIPAGSKVYRLPTIPSECRNMRRPSILHPSQHCLPHLQLHALCPIPPPSQIRLDTMLGSRIVVFYPSFASWWVSNDLNTIPEGLGRDQVDHSVVVEVVLLLPSR